MPAPRVQRGEPMVARTWNALARAFDAVESRVQKYAGGMPMPCVSVPCRNDSGEEILPGYVVETGAPISGSENGVDASAFILTGIKPRYTGITQIGIALSPAADEKIFKLAVGGHAPVRIEAFGSRPRRFIAQQDSWIASPSPAGTLWAAGTTPWTGESSGGWEDEDENIWAFIRITSTRLDFQHIDHFARRVGTAAVIQFCGAIALTTPEIDPHVPAIVRISPV